MKIRNLSLLIITLLTTAVALTNLYTSRANPAPAALRPTMVELIGLGAITLTPGQGLRVNLVNAVETSNVRLTVKFIGNDGQVLKSEEHSLSPGSTGGTAVFTPGDILGGILVGNTHLPVHVIVESVPDAPEAPPFPYVLPSLEIFDRKAGKVLSTHASFLRLNSASRAGGQ